MLPGRHDATDGDSPDQTAAAGPEAGTSGAAAAVAGHTVRVLVRDRDARPVLDVHRAMNCGEGIKLKISMIFFPRGKETGSPGEKEECKLVQEDKCQTDSGSGFEGSSVLLCD